MNNDVRKTEIIKKLYLIDEIKYLKLVNKDKANNK